MSGKTDISWMIGGPQGSGVDSSATLFSRAMTAAGYWIFGKREYHSNIKGKHSYFQVRVKNEPVLSNVDPVHLLATFESTTAEIHAHEIVDGGALIYDPKVTKPETLEMSQSVVLFPLNYDELIQQMADETGQHVTKLAIMKNVISVAASLALLGVDLSAIEDALKGLFTGRRAKLVQSNVQVAKKAYDAIMQVAGWDTFAFKMAPPTNPPAKGSRLVINGAASCGLGKLKAGCRFQTYYSITPAVDECIFLEEHPEFGTVVFQAEDELAAVNMAISAGTTGIRASTSTSGPGFCLMAEGLGWAGISEVPVVVFDYQRGGPSTGLPTRNEQGDLLFAIFGGHSDVPKIVISPGDMHEAFEDSFNAFNFADRYQTLVVVLPEKQLANSTQSILPFNDKALKIDRGQIVEADKDYREGDVERGIQKYPRYQVTESGVSPRPLPGTPGKIFWMTGDEHTEYGHITEKPEIRMAQHEKRMRKLDLAAKEIPVDLQYKLYGPENADLTIVSWGANKGPILDGMKVLSGEHKLTVNFLHIRLMCPFPADGVAKILKNAKRVLTMESNFSGQLAQLITMKTGIQIPHQVVKYTGRPISETEVVAASLKVHQEKTERVVLTYGH